MPFTADDSRIEIHNQGSYPHLDYSRDSGSLTDNGCGLFTLNHAMQWVGMSNVPSPESMAQTDMERGLLGFDPGYFVKSANTYGFLAEDLYRCCNDREQFRSRIDQLFSRGNVVTLHVRGDNGFTGRRTAGHYCAGVGITADKSKVHIIDSSSGTTLGVLKSTEYNGYYYSNGSLKPIDKSWDSDTTIRAVTGNRASDYFSGAEYWVDFDFIWSNQRFYDGRGNDSGWTVAIKRKPRSARIRVVGDVMVCTSQLQVCKDSDYDFHPEFEYIRDALSNADYTMANMEGTVGKHERWPYSGYPQFNCPETILEALKDSGVDFLTLANNHMLDRLFTGLKNTVSWVEKYGFDHVGAYRTRKERETATICEVNGIRIGFVAYTYFTNEIESIYPELDPAATEYGVPYIYNSDFAADIKRLRDAGAEVVIAFPHCGTEYVQQPDASQMEYAEKLAAAGADIILCSHSHAVQPMTLKRVTDSAGRSREVLVAYSLGNFLSDHRLQYTDSGVIIEFTISENDDGSFSTGGIGYIPTYCWQPTRGDVRVLPSAKYLMEGPVGMTGEAHARLVQSYREITGILSDAYPVLEG